MPQPAVPSIPLSLIQSANLPRTNPESCSPSNERDYAHPRRTDINQRYKDKDEEEQEQEQEKEGEVSVVEEQEKEASINMFQDVRNHTMALRSRLNYTYSTLGEEIDAYEKILDAKKVAESSMSTLREILQEAANEERNLDRQLDQVHGLEDELLEKLAFHHEKDSLRRRD